jgi:hypothetical protein
MCEMYHGFKNYETWCVNEWLTNEEDTAEQLAWIVNGTHGYAHKPEDVLEAHVNDLCNQEFDAHSYGMFADLLTASLNKVDWYEIVQVHLENSKEAICK